LERKGNEKHFEGGETMAAKKPAKKAKKKAKKAKKG